MDLWNKLRSASLSLSEGNENSKTGKSLVQECETLLGYLEQIEHHFAFPGMRRFMSLKAAFGRQEFVALSHIIVDIRRELISESYRSSGELIKEYEQDEDQEASAHSHGGKQNYFEVLVVEDISEDDEKAMRKRVAGLRQEGDQFTYGLVVQRSFQDALITLLFNTNIQSVVVRYAPPFARNEIDPIIMPYIQHALDLGCVYYFFLVHNLHRV